MAGSLNKVMIIGNLGRDPEIRAIQGGGKVATLNVATSESWLSKQTGEREEKTEWHRVVIFGKGAETVEKFLKKGSKAYFEGRLQTRKWTDKDNQERYTTEVVADNFTFLDRKEGGGDSYGGSPSSSDGGSYKPASTGAPKKISSDAPFDDDIPF